MIHLPVVIKCSQITSPRVWEAHLLIIQAKIIQAKSRARDSRDQKNSFHHMPLKTSGDEDQRN